MIIRIGIFAYQPNELKKIIENEWDERRAEKGSLQLAFTATDAFRDLGKKLNEFTDNYIESIDRKIERDEIVTPAEIYNVRTLERLQLMTRFDPCGDHFKRVNQELENGKGSLSADAAWKILERRARFEGVLDGVQDDMETRVRRIAYAHQPISQ